MVKRFDMTRPRMRLQEGTDPSAALKRLYGAGQLDRGGGLIGPNKDGELPRGAGFKSLGPSYNAVQDKQSGPAPGYGGRVNQNSWLLDSGGDATKRPFFDHSKKRGGR